MIWLRSILKSSHHVALAMKKELLRDPAIILFERGPSVGDTSGSTGQR